MTFETSTDTPIEAPSSDTPADEAPPVTWKSLGLAEQLLALIEKAGYQKPTPVQVQSIPLVLEGEDVLVSSQTGSGKTAAFVLPTVQRYLGKEGTFILALSPTREIAQQTQAVFETFGAPLGLRSTVLIGGANMRLEEQALGTYPQIIVATPGRLCDHLERGNIWLDFIQTLILDEADRMLDMGFADQLAKITESIPKTRQTLMFSATFAPSVERLARSAMRSPKQVTIGKSEGSAPKIEQRAVRMREEEKVTALIRLFQKEPGTLIVFCRSKDRVSKLWRSLHSRLVYDATFIHSDRPQADREKAIADFKAGTYRILIATDVAGRGIDVDDVAHVVNFDLPLEAEDYVHRIGRTGRRGRTGVATSFVTDRDREQVRRIERLIGKKLFGSDEGQSSGSTSGSNDSRSDRPRDDRPRGDRRPPQSARPAVSASPTKIILRRDDSMVAAASADVSDVSGDSDEGETVGSESESGSSGAPQKRRRRRRGGRGKGPGPSSAKPSGTPTSST